MSDHKKQMIEVGLKLVGHIAIIGSAAVVGAFLKQWGNENTKDGWSLLKQGLNLYKNRKY